MDENMKSNIPVIQIDNYSDDISKENDSENVDQYSAGIDLLNACREFYVSRLEVVSKVKKQYEFCDCAKKSIASKSAEEISSSERTDYSDYSKLSCPNCSSTWKNYKNEKNKGFSDKRMDIEKTMSILRYEMASLIEQDLDIMKNLLQLNEQIEQFKWHCKLYPCVSMSNSSIDSCIDPQYHSDRSISSCHSTNISNKSITDVENLHNNNNCYENNKNNDDSLSCDKKLSPDVVSNVRNNLTLTPDSTNNIYESNIPNEQLCEDDMDMKTTSFEGFFAEVELSKSSLRKDSNTDVESYDSGFHEPIPANDSPF